jgi:hypothetical protein
MSKYKVTNPFNYGPTRLEVGTIVELGPVQAGQLQPWIEPIEPLGDTASSGVIGPHNCVITGDSPTDYGRGQVADDAAYHRFEADTARRIKNSTT